MTAEHELPAWSAGKVRRWSDALSAQHVPARHDAEPDDMAVMPYTSGVEFADALPKSSTGKVMWRTMQELENSRTAPGGKS
jgi:acyl-coenzyme A synthetase/AMP-(fatty) acid ligase